MTSVSPYLKRKEAVVLGIETTRGTAASQQYTYPWLTKGLMTVPSFLENESAMGDDHRVNDSAIDVSHSEGPLGGKVREDGMFYLNQGMFNKVTTTDNGDGTTTDHFEYDSTAAAKTFSIWDVRPSTTRLFKACEFDSLELSVEAGEKGAWLEANGSVKGYPHEDVSAVTPAIDTDELEFTSRMVKLYLADDLAGLADTTASRVKPRSIKLTLKQDKTPDHSLGDGNIPEMDKGTFEPTGEMVIKYRKTDFEEDYFANAIHAMKIEAINGDVTLSYTATKVRFRELTPSDDRDEVVTQSISFTCEADHTNSGHAIVSDLTRPTPA